MAAKMIICVIHLVLLGAKSKYLRFDGWTVSRTGDLFADMTIQMQIIHYDLLDVLRGLRHIARQLSFRTHPHFVVHE